MAMVRKKQDDKYLEALRELITTGGGNRQCFDCGQKGPTYINMTIGSFVCTRCSGVLRGITPPHRVKSISMATFTQDEIDFLKSHGNDVCAKTWLGLWDPKRAVHQDQRELMIDKYERKRYYLEPASPLKSLTNATNLKTTTAAAAATSSSTCSTSANNNQINNNNNRNSNNGTNNKTQIQLTPPTSQRTTANGLHKTSSSAISRPQHSTHQVQNGSLSSSHTTDAFGLHNGLKSSVGSVSTGALSDTSSCASANGFGAEADFVADFNSADIFNATAASSPASSIASSTTNSGYAKIQPMKMPTTAQQQFMNGKNINLQNGNISNGNTENFADFDHAPIYNAAVVEEMSNYQFVRKNAIRKKSSSGISNSIIQRNECQLKDILEMDNNENGVDYINFEEDDKFGLSQTKKNTNNKKTGYSNLFEDFDALLALDDNRQQQQPQKQVKTNLKDFKSDYMNIGDDNLTTTKKFTPLALAAHATAMAVLGNQSNFNPQLHTLTNVTSNSPPSYTANKWDMWSNDDPAYTTTATPWFTYETPKWQQQQHSASINNFNSGNLLAQQQQQLQQYPQHLSSSKFSTTHTLTSTSFPSSIIFDTAKIATTSSSPSPLTTTKATVTTTTTSMFHKNTINSTNPFRMHLDVNDNDNNNNNHNTINYNDYNYFNYLNTTATTTLTPTTDSDFNTNFNHNFDFLSNSILSCNTDQFATATRTTTTTTMASSIISLPSMTRMAAMTTTTIPTDNYYINDNNNNYNYNYNNNIENSNLNSKYYHCDMNNDKINITNTTTNPFSNSLNNAKIDQDLLHDPYSTQISSTSISSISFITTDATTTTATTSFVTCCKTTSQNPFILTSSPTPLPPPPLPTQLAFRSYHQHRVADENSNIYLCNDNNNNYCYNSNNNNIVDNKQIVANNFCFGTNANIENNSNSISISNSSSNYNFNTYCNTNSNLNQNDNETVHNNSWRLPINNNNKNSTTNGFSNNNISNNNNNINNNNNNNNSSAPAEDRYAALKDLDEQLRESKAIAAQAASIVTANVVDSGFGNPNLNGTVNPFATHHHQSTAVVNPFQNTSNNPTQNTAQQLLGQMTLIPNGITAANGFLNGQKTHTANTGFFNYTASGFTNANTLSQIQQQQQQQQQQQNQLQASVMYPTSIQARPNGCGFGFGTLQQQIASTGTGLTTNTFNNPFAATGALNSNNPFL